MINTVIFDLDGTILLGNTPIEGAIKTVHALRAQGKRVLFLTNAASYSRRNLAIRLANIGFGTSPEETYGWAYLLAKYISRNHKGKKVYVVGEKGIFDEFADAGVPVANEQGSDADIVAVGLDRQLSYEKLSNAHAAIKRGALFIASNTDNTWPNERGTLPGTGSIVAALECSTGKRPYVVGKPNSYAYEVMEKENSLKKSEVIMVGDRVDTDIVFAKNSGILSALVAGNATASKSAFAPDYVFGKISEFSLPSSP